MNMGTENTTRIDELNATIHRIGSSKTIKVRKLLEQEWPEVKQNIATISDEVRRRYQEVFLRYGKEAYSDEILAETQKQHIEKAKRLFEQVANGDYEATGELDNLMFPLELPLVGQQKISFEDLEVTQAFFLEKRRACFIQKGKELVKAIKAGDPSMLSKLYLLIHSANLPFKDEGEIATSEQPMVLRHEDLEITEKWLRKKLDDQKLKGLRVAIDKARGGDYTDLPSVGYEFNHKFYTPRKLRTTVKEFNELEHQRNLRLAWRDFEEAKKGNWDSLLSLRNYFRTLVGHTKPQLDYAELGFDKESFKTWFFERSQAMAEGWVKECQKGDYTNLDKLKSIIEFEHVTLDALEITEATLNEWLADADRRSAEEIGKEIEQGKYDYIDILEDLLTKRTVTLKDAKINQADFKKLKKERDMRYGVALLKEEQSGNYRAKESLKYLLERRNVTRSNLKRALGMKQK